MLKNKKSQIFSLIAIAIIMLLFVSYEVYSIIYERAAIKTRIRTMDNFLFSLEQDLSRKLYISGFRIIFLAENEITRTGNYIPSFQNFFEEAISNGTINGQVTEILYGTTIQNITEDIQEKADKMSIIANFTNVKVSVSQEDPWNLVIYFNATLNLTDKRNLAGWYKNETIKSFVSIEGFEDPLYLISTSGIARKIYRTPYEGNYVNEGDKTNLSSHLENKYYANNTDAPSFIHRIEGNLQANPNGIETFVYIPEFSAMGFSKSIVDHIYFNLADNTQGSTILDMPSWFKIDTNHCLRYQLTC